MRTTIQTSEELSVQLPNGFRKVDKPAVFYTMPRYANTKGEYKAADLRSQLSSHWPTANCLLQRGNSPDLSSTWRAFDALDARGLSSSRGHAPATRRAAAKPRT